MNHHMTSPVAGSGEDRLTAEIFMMLQRDDPSSELHRDVVNAVMQDRQAPPDFEEQQQFQHHQRMHQLQLLQQQQLLQNRHHQHQQQRSHSSSQANLWAQYQQPHSSQLHYSQQYQQEDYTQEEGEDDFGDYSEPQYQQQSHGQKEKPTSKKPKKPSKKKSSKKLPTAATANTPPAAAAVGVVADAADAAAIATAAAVAANAAATIMPPTLPLPPGPPGKYAVGTFVTKHFPAFGWFKGRIIHYDHTCKQYKIQYEDADLEDLTESELTKVFERAERAKPGYEQEIRRKRRARYDVGTKVKKLFYAFGWFDGTIEEFDDETDYYRVVYSDGDKEDLDEEEVLEILTDPRNHKKPRHWVQPKLTKKEKEEYTLATFDPIQAFWLPVAPPPPPAKYEIGTELYKFFPEHGWFKGTITSFDADAQLYKVQYEDKDKEDLEEKELSKLLERSKSGPLGKYSVGEKIAKYFSGHGWYKGQIVSYNPVLRLYKVQYEDKDKEDLDEGEVTKALENAHNEEKLTTTTPKKAEQASKKKRATP
jgi:Lamin-B receptor of TUDOR domain